ncbi:hypothetical protein DA89_2734 [Vibrio paracholerae]|nr:hypothetical protein DA89_2734 [Vibrio paracholerae]
MRCCPSYTDLESPDFQLELRAHRESTAHHR